MAQRPQLSYHFSGFCVGKNAEKTWIDGVIQLDVAILTQEHYLGLKKSLAERYHAAESNLIITSLNRLDTLQFESPSIAFAQMEEVTAS